MNKIWFAAEDNQACRRHFGDSQWRQMAFGQIKVLGTTDISRWQKHRSWFKANFSSKTARASVCIGNYQFCPHWQTGLSTVGLFAWGRGGENFCGGAPPPVLNSQWRLFPRQRRETLSCEEGKRAPSLDPTNNQQPWIEPNNKQRVIFPNQPRLGRVMKKEN